MGKTSSDFSGRNTARRVDATLNGNPAPVESGNPTIGEGFGIGSRYTAVLNERPLQDGNNNFGPVRPSGNTGAVPTVGMGVRKTGRL